MILMDVYCERCQGDVRIDDGMALCDCVETSDAILVDLAQPFWEMDENRWSVRSWSNVTITVQTEGV